MFVFALSSSRLNQKTFVLGFPNCFLRQEGIQYLSNLFFSQHTSPRKKPTQKPFRSHMSTPEIFLPAMDRRDHHFQSLSFCNKLYKFFTKTLLTCALKPVILGHPLHQNLDCKSQNGTTHETDQTLHSQTKKSPSECKQESRNTITDSFMTETNEGIVNGENRAYDHERRPEEEASLPFVAPQTKAPKKVVSINERVEEITSSNKKIKRKKSTEKSSSFEFQEEDEPKPLKSILKVGSNLGDRPNSFVSPANDG